ncbi:MAG TPA: hypothetical protein VHC67_16675 [Gaiellaceae bacterium]|jgi:hypothetical protein|nr:hypothetical protein [Gaiellaceae bacterium]
MGSVSVCDECHGAGAHGYDRGPIIERCLRCGGAGVLFGDERTALNDLTTALTSSRSAELFVWEGSQVRALAALAARLEARVAALEREIAKDR